MAWILRLVKTGAEGEGPCTALMEIHWPGDLVDIADLGLTLAEATRLNKAQRMRWPRRGADLLLQVRCAAYDGTLGSGFGQRFQPANDPYLLMAAAA